MLRQNHFHFAGQQIGYVFDSQGLRLSSAPPDNGDYETFKLQEQDKTAFRRPRSKSSKRA